MFNKFRESLSLLRLDAVKPSHTQCGGCHQYVKLEDKRHPCSDEQRPVPSLVASFKPVTTVILDYFGGSVDGLVSHAAINQLCHNLERNRDEAKLWGAPDTLEGHLKYLIRVETHTVTPAVLQLLLVGLSVACSEGIAETYGSFMESYLKERFVNPGPANDDVGLQKEMFLRINGPSVAHSKSFCERIASGLSHVGPTSSYQQLPVVQRRNKVSRVVKRLTTVMRRL